MSSYFDRNLVQNLRKSLEKDDLRSQASRIHSMLTTVSTFIQKLQESKSAVQGKRELENELQNLKHKKEKTSEEEMRFKELEEDLKEIVELERQINKSKANIKAVVSAVDDLHQTLKRM